MLQFTESHSYNDGWVIKLPFVTHSLGIKFTKDRSKIPSIIEYMVLKYSSFVPYVMVQPCVPNRLEYKVVLLDGVPRYHHTKGSGRSFGCIDSVYSFASTALQMLKAARPATICKGLVRVDIMQNPRMGFVVNEFESVEADYNCSDINKSAAAADYLRLFWQESIASSIGSLR